MLLLRGEMGVAHGHLEGGMAHQFLNRLGMRSLGRQATSEIMPGVMEPEITHSCPSEGLLNPRLSGPPAPAEAALTPSETGPSRMRGFSVSPKPPNSASVPQESPPPVRGEFPIRRQIATLFAIRHRQVFGQDRGTSRVRSYTNYHLGITGRRSREPSLPSRMVFWALIDFAA